MKSTAGDGRIGVDLLTLLLTYIARCKDSSYECGTSRCAFGTKKYVCICILDSYT